MEVFHNLRDLNYHLTNDDFFKSRLRYFLESSDLVSRIPFVSVEDYCGGNPDRIKKELSEMIVLGSSSRISKMEVSACNIDAYSLRDEGMVVSFLEDFSNLFLCGKFPFPGGGCFCDRV